MNPTPIRDALSNLVRPFVALACVACLVVPSVQAQGFPSKTIKLISGATAGSASDIIGRAVGEKLQA